MAVSVELVGGPRDGTVLTPTYLGVRVVAFAPESDSELVYRIRETAQAKPGPIPYDFVEERPVV